MKTIRYMLAAAAVMSSLSSCYIRISDEGRQKIKERLETEALMNEIVYDKDDSLVCFPGSFNSVSNKSSVDVTFIQCEGEPKVVITGRYRSRDSLRIENVDGVLWIRQIEGHLGLIWTQDTEVTVYAPGIESLSNTGSGDVDISGTLEAGSFEITNFGSGDILFEKGIIGGPISVVNQGSGDIAVKECQTDSLLTINNNGSGDIAVRGKAGETTVSNLGSGDIDISRLETTLLEVNSKGSGDVIRR
ncbi:MAG: DUF2807 domain-containing protein [Bacteroidales bacterium]|nr:DUF2807 domain-containing protein [Bacteroidales bacterium]